MAAFLGEDTLVQKHLASSQKLLSQLPREYNDQFDHVSWYQYKGTCALILNQHECAAEELQQAIDNLPARSIIRLATTLCVSPLYARSPNRDPCLEVTKRAADVVKTISAPRLNKQFVEYVHQEILASFPDDYEIKSFAADIQLQILPVERVVHLN